ncbi:hypothetical protein [Telluribacter sp.]|uniref:hypothetical protein n=1 Tax=Telluribacter sp. TaxID=1978767 RepID=UPI002E1624CD|nr:hypothetical protein [Telluribacter sp.]
MEVWVKVVKRGIKGRLHKPCHLVAQIGFRVGPTTIVATTIVATVFQEQAERRRMEQGVPLPSLKLLPATTRPPDSRVQIAP